MDCDDLPGRLKEICNGTARKSNGEFFAEHEREAILSRRLAAKESSFSVSANTPLVSLKTGGCGRCGKKK
jgi:hypothetical protein